MQRLPPRDIVLALPELASPPEVYQRLVRVLDRPDWTVAHLSEVLSADAGIAARTLRLANSPLYGMPREIGTLDEAVTVIGIAELRNLVLLTTVIESFHGIPAGLVSLRKFWRRAVRCGVAASLLAGRLGDADRRCMFLAGLLHDVGSLVCCLVLPEPAREAALHLPEGDGFPVSIERLITGDRTAVVGAILLHHWRLPENLIAPVRWHPVPSEAGDHARSAAVVNLAVWLASASEAGVTDPFSVVPREHPHWSLAALDDSDVGGLMTEIAGGTEQMLAAFGAALR
jgi:HD-like signal output (HDOD) protein